MKIQKYLLCSGLIAALSLAAAVPSVWCKAPAGKGASASTFTAADAKILRSGDKDAVAEVLFKLVKLHDVKGRDALKPAVQPLIDSAWREIRLPEDQRWNLFDIIKVISMTGDPKTKPVLLHMMSTVRGASSYCARGFLSMGPEMAKELADSLQSKLPGTKGRTAQTLNKMAQLDKTGKYFSAQNRDLIKNRLVANLKDTDVNVLIYTVSALGAFGDASVIPALEMVEKTDAHKDSGGVYEVRVEATSVLKKLRGKK